MIPGGVQTRLEAEIEAEVLSMEGKIFKFRTRPVTHLVPRDRMIAGDEEEARGLTSAPAGFDARRREMSL